MRKVIVSILVSLDGSFEGPNKELDWHVWDDIMEKYMGGFSKYRRRYIIGTCGLSAISKLLAVVEGEPCSNVE
jgi:hypothetical protein